MENKNIQTEFNIFEITKKLIGHTGIACESNYDKESWENLELVHDLLIQWMYKLVVDVERYHDAAQASAQRIVARQKNILSEIRDYIKDIERYLDGE